ncbi:MAG TPA: amino acid permease [Cyclobacteriaceae bacterium]
MPLFNPRQLTATKSLSEFEAEAGHTGLNRILNKWSLTALGIGCIIGAGIFVMTGLAAREFAGPALTISFLVAGIGCACAALCYAEFASILPVAGSAYSYSYATMGELFAWIIGWDLIIEYSMSSSTVAVGWSGYFVKLMESFGVHFPLWAVNDPETAHGLISKATANGTLADLATHYSSIDLPTIAGFGIAINLPAVLVSLLVMFILTKGIKEAANTNVAMVILKVSVVLFVIIVGAFFVDINNWDPFIPMRGVNDHGDAAFGVPGILTAAAYVFFAYIGFDAVSTQAGEALNPKKDIPFGILASLAICTALYILVSLVLTGMVKYTDLDINAPVAAAFSAKGMKFASWFISIAAVAGLTSVLLVNILAQTRLFFSMAKDGLLPDNFFGKLHSKFKTPFNATIITGIAIAVVAGIFPLSVIAKLVNIGTLFAFVIIIIAVFMMRRKNPDTKRGFRVPALPFIGALGIMFNVGMMISLGWENWLRLFLWMAVGLVIYWFYGQKNSRLNKKNIESINQNTKS